MKTTVTIKEEIKPLVVASPAFSEKEFIPEKYTCDGENINPPILVKDIPGKTKSMVLIVDDPDAPVRTWNHWLVWNIPPARKINEHSIPGVEGVTDFRTRKYSGPCPPDGTHSYHFKVYALDALLDLGPQATKHELEKKMANHILAFGETVGLYQRNTTT